MMGPKDTHMSSVVKRRDDKAGDDLFFVQGQALARQLMKSKVAQEYKGKGGMKRSELYEETGNGGRRVMPVIFNNKYRASIHDEKDTWGWCWGREELRST